MATNAFFDTGCSGLQKLHFMCRVAFAMQPFSICNRSINWNLSPCIVFVEMAFFLSALIVQV